MRIEAEHVALVARKLEELGAGDWVRARGERDAVYVESIDKPIQYVRLRRTAARSWQLEDLRPSDKGLIWVRVRGTQRGRIESFLSRWDDPYFTEMDFRFDRRARKRELAQKARYRGEIAVAALNAEPLYALGRLLARKDAAGLVKEVRLAVEHPTEYCKRFEERLGERGIETPGDVVGTTLPWIALIDGLKARRLLAEIDWREESGDTLKALRQNQGGLLAKHDWSWESRAPLLDTEKFLGFADRKFAAEGVRLAVVNMGADNYPLVLYPSDDHDALKTLAAQCKKLGFGELRLFSRSRSKPAQSGD